MSDGESPVSALIGPRWLCPNARSNCAQSKRHLHLQGNASALDAQDGILFKPIAEALVLASGAVVFFFHLIPWLVTPTYKD